MIESFPCQWPVGFPRTPPAARREARFHRRVDVEGSDYKRKVRTTLHQGIVLVRDELALFKATDVVISTNVPTRLDGLPYSSAKEPDDPAAAVYFRLNGETRCLQCDAWNRVADNLCAIGHTIAGKRDEIRWKVGTAAQMWAGYKMLPAMDAGRTWWAVLGFKDPPNSLETVRGKYETRIREVHPDHGGNGNQAAEINAALRDAKTYYKAE
jgi:hypothetical protein